jgi:hypothetical protein
MAYDGQSRGRNYGGLYQEHIWSIDGISWSGPHRPSGFNIAWRLYREKGAHRFHSADGSRRMHGRSTLDSICVTF